MTRVQDALLMHQRRRFMRLDASRYLRPDASRYVRPDTKYSPDQPRDDHGRWTDAGGESTEASTSSSEGSELVDLGFQVAANGHHYVPRGVFEKEKYSFSADTLDILENAKTGPLHDPTSNRFDVQHREYNKAVEESLDRFLERNGIRSEQMTPKQAETFADEVKRSSDPRIRQFNMRLWMRELNYWLRRGPRGRE